MTRPWNATGAVLLFWAAGFAARAQVVPVEPAPDEAILRDFRFSSGETLPELKIRYVTYGRRLDDGRGKTANAVLANAFNQPAIVVDTHVWRLSQRLGLTSKDDPDKIEADLVTLVPRKEWTKFCHLLQFHGRRVCTARNPNCPNCSINKLCPWPHQTKAAGK